MIAWPAAIRRCFVFGQYLERMSQCPLRFCNSFKIYSVGYGLEEGVKQKNE